MSCCIFIHLAVKLLIILLIFLPCDHDAVVGTEFGRRTYQLTVIQSSDSFQPCSDELVTGHAPRGYLKSLVNKNSDKFIQSLFGIESFQNKPSFPAVWPNEWKQAFRTRDLTLVWKTKYRSYQDFFAFWDVFHHFAVYDGPLHSLSQVMQNVVLEICTDVAHVGQDFISWNPCKKKVCWIKLRLISFQFSTTEF